MKNSSSSQLPGNVLNHSYVTAPHAGDMVENLILLLSMICHPYQRFELVIQFDSLHHNRDQFHWSAFTFMRKAQKMKCTYACLPVLQITQFILKL